MKTFTSAVFGIALAAAASTGTAGTVDIDQLASCKDALAGVYDDDYHFRLKSVNGGRIKKMLIKVIPPEGRGSTVRCWRDGAGTLRLTDRDGVALIEADYDPTDKVSLLD